MLISRNLHKKSTEVSIKRSTPASLSFKGQVTKRTTVKWSILLTIIFASHYLLTEQSVTKLIIIRIKKVWFDMIV